MMKRVFAVVAALCLSAPVLAADLANGEKINRSCALCHGVYGQGAPGKLSPRIAGMPKYYLEKAIRDYRDGARSYPLMNKTSGLEQMTDKDIEDISAYLASMDLSSDARFNIRRPDTGKVAAGEELYLDECKVCHKRDGYGKERKGAPPLAGQHPAYLYTVMKGFQKKSRVHDNDPEDDTFLEYTDDQIISLAAHLARLDDDKIVEGYEFAPPTIKVASTAQTPEEKAGLEINSIQQTVVKIALAEGRTTEEAVEAMEAKAAEIDLRRVSAQFVSKHLEKKGVDTPYLSIHQFCDPMDARTMIIANPLFSSYMPCRISMVEDQQGKIWLMMLNLDMLINSKLLDQDVVETAVKVNQKMLEVMVTGADGGS